MKTGICSEKRQHFSEVFYCRYREHFIKSLIKLGPWMLCSGTLAFLFMFSFLKSGNNGVPAVLMMAVFIFICVAACNRLLDFSGARVIPYFERRLGNTKTWLCGKSFLQNSRKLDKIAAERGVSPLSEFASGDDLISGETLTWFPVDGALRTLDSLLAEDVAANLPGEVITDLELFRDALTRANAESVKFSFVLREGHSTSGAEMDRRKGSFF